MLNMSHSVEPQLCRRLSLVAPNKLAHRLMHSPVCLTAQASTKTTNKPYAHFAKHHPSPHAHAQLPANSKPLRLKVQPSMTCDAPPPLLNTMPPHALKLAKQRAQATTTPCTPCPSLTSPHSHSLLLGTAQVQLPTLPSLGCSAGLAAAGPAQQQLAGHLLHQAPAVTSQ